MSFIRHGRTFDGAFLTPDSIKTEAGVYIIWERCLPGDTWRALDVGEAGILRDRLKTHDRSDQWAQACKGAIYYSATYTPDLTDEQRRALERAIRLAEKPCCGER